MDTSSTTGTALVNLVFASAASAISVTRKGAVISSPQKDEIDKFLKERM